MNAENDNDKKINELFKKVVTMATVDAFDFLNAVDGDVEVVQQVVKLLSDSETRTTFLANNPEFESILQPISAEKDLVGQCIGDIELIKLLGKGGMGEVYLGEDKQLQRKVAVKTIRGVYRLNHQARDRFRREALILSKLNHENICKIYNILEIGDIDFLVLEYIDGKTLNKISLKEKTYSAKLKMAQAMLAGLMVAHKEDIVHRDIKPDNIIVSDSGLVKILDFGISSSLKHSEPPIRQTTTADKINNQSTSIHSTNPGTILGTLGYMSPEQANGEEVRTASDIYSLGLIFQELFSNESAHDRSLSKEELLERSKEGISKPIKNIPHDLAQLINRMKAPKSAARPTSFDAAVLLQNIIDKPKRRMRWLFGFLLLLTAVVGIGKYTYDLNEQKLRAETAKLEAEKANEESKQIIAFLESLFKVSDPYSSRGEVITARQMLDDGAKRVDEELKGQARSIIRMKMTIGEIYRKLGMYPEAEQQFNQANQYFETNQLNDVEQEIFLLGLMATLDYETSKYDQMIETLTKAIELSKAHGLTESKDYLSLRFNLAAAYEEKSEHEKAITTFEELLQIYLKNPKKYKIELITTYNYIGLINADADNLEKSKEYINKAITYLSPNEEEDVEFRTSLYANLGTIHADMGEYEEAVQLGLKVAAIREKVLGSKHNYLALTYDNISKAYCNMNKIKLCGKYINKALEIYKSTGNTDSVDYALTLGGQASFLGKTPAGDLKAEKLWIQSIEILHSRLGENHIKIADHLTSLGINYINQKKYPSAIETLKKAIKMYLDLKHKTQGRSVDAWQSLAQAYKKENKTSLQLSTYRSLLALLKKEQPQDKQTIASTQASIDEITQALQSP